MGFVSPQESPVDRPTTKPMDRAEHTVFSDVPRKRVARENNGPPLCQDLPTQNIW